MVVRKSDAKGDVIGNSSRWGRKQFGGHLEVERMFSWAPQVCPIVAGNIRLVTGEQRERGLRDFLERKLV